MEDNYVQATQRKPVVLTASFYSRFTEFLTTCISGTVDFSCMGRILEEIQFFITRKNLPDSASRFDGLTFRA